MDLKILQEEFREYFDKCLKPKKETMKNLDRELCVNALERAYTLGMMKGVEMVEGVVEKEASAKHDNHEDWQYGNCDCDGVFDYSEIKHIIKKLKQELK